MIGQRGRRWARIALGVVAGGALALGFAAPAAAAPATGVAKSVPGSKVTLLLNGKPKPASALALKIDGKTLPAFCIDYHTNVAINGKYAEGTWDESQVKNLGKVQWVLTHGYPNADQAKLLAAAGATMPEKLDEAKRNNLLYFGTQTAVWHFSDGIELGDWVKDKGLLGKQQYDVVKKVHDYLVANATDQPEPKAELTVDPTNAKATVGEKAGPFTVKGPAGEITIKVTGGVAVDAEGKPVTATTNGGQFWLTAEEAGEVEATLSAKGSVSFGRVFLYTGGKAQKLILGGSTDETVTAKAAATFTAAPSSPTPTPTTPAETPSPSAPAESPAPSTSPASNGGDLPLTGSPIATAITAGLVLLAAGAVTVLVVRRRKVRFTA
ncbi:LPXTG-motif cell wall anchor domain-containing protein/TQXA domain-containing protein [Micromonospora echinaurantiaca]|uniref:LPXTG-motif cell wall anchor domain-containing protein/TQXA domain-containing protein n=1 Tax=Micromonospora echinaurantiaca TaxID=47857 RepID=A0A1C5GP38_9ACTN|nr:thioester domain-containing protein [Micromonospora echinaurantiaca]SCG35568.1 LPXTG-motif cell wall anchor domain-containing protein/TQXA domain-containing protein [Micromonospora echinaurantiaca]